MLTFFTIRNLFNIETELESNEVFKAVATHLKRKGDCRSPPSPISENDFKQLTMRKSCRRVRENLTIEDTFKLKKKHDSDRQFIYKKKDELVKDHRADAQSIVTEGLMYEIQGIIMYKHNSLSQLSLY